MVRRIALSACTAASLGLLAVAGPSVSQEDEAGGPRIYKWVDTNGIAHYTTDPDAVPDELRTPLDRLRRERTATPQETDDPWAQVSQDEPDDLWVAQDAIGSAEPDPSGAGVGEEADSAAEQRRKAERRALEAQIAELQAKITADEDLLKGWISNPEVDPVLAADDPAFREVALRLPRLQGDLAKLEEKRRAMGGTPEDAAP